MGITRRYVDAVIKMGWEPYIKRTWLNINVDNPTRSRTGVIISFKDHEMHEYKCSAKTGNEILALGRP